MKQDRYNEIDVYVVPLGNGKEADIIVGEIKQRPLVTVRIWDKTDGGEWKQKSSGISLVGARGDREQLAWTLRTLFSIKDETEGPDTSPSFSGDYSDRPRTEIVGARYHRSPGRKHQRTVATRESRG